jgi:hypothetical protein
MSDYQRIKEYLTGLRALNEKTGIYMQLDIPYYHLKDFESGALLVKMLWDQHVEDYVPVLTADAWEKKDG